MRRFALFLIALLAVVKTISGQDIAWLVEQSPIVTGILLKTLEKSPSFTAKVDVQVKGVSDPSPSTAAGTLEYMTNNVRWEAKLADVSSSQLTANARAAVKQVNGDQFLLLTRSDQQANFLVLKGANACLESRFPSFKAIGRPTRLGQETNLGHLCVKERIVMPTTDRGTNEVLLWRAKDLKNLPTRIQISNAGDKFVLQLQNVRFQQLRPDRFSVPTAIPKYDNFEDLVQSVLLEKMKRRIGLQ